MVSKIIASRGILKVHMPGGRTFFSASVLWELLAPKSFQWFISSISMVFLDWILLAFPCIAIKKYAPRKYVKYFEPLLLLVDS